MLHQVTAIVRTSRVDDVCDACGRANLTVTEVHGSSRQHGHTETYRGAEYRDDLVPKVRVDLLVEEERLDEVLALVREAAVTGRVGDGKVWVTPVEDVVRVRTGERGAAAV